MARAPVSAILKDHYSGLSDEWISDNFDLSVDQVRTILAFEHKVQPTNSTCSLKVLFDQNIAKGLRRFTPSHLSRTAAEKRWSRLKNGDLIEAVEGGRFEGFVPADQSIRHQPNLIAIIELSLNDWAIKANNPVFTSVR